MNLEVLISAMHLKDSSIVERTHCKTDVLIINQSDCNSYWEANDHFKVRMISTTERGLSNSRNAAINNAEGDICLLCDDDEELVDGYENIIINAFNDYPQADIIAFDMQVKSSNETQPRYTKTLNYGKSLSPRKAPYFKTYASVQLAFKRKSILDANVLFDNRFGSGSGIISAGDETVWQVDAKRKGLQIYYVPKLIAFVRQDESQWFNGLNEKYYYDLGACLGKNYPVAHFVLKFYYVFFIHGSSLSKIEQLKWLDVGIKEFKSKGISYEEYISRKNECV